MAQTPLHQDAAPPSSFATSYLPTPSATADITPPSHWRVSSHSDSTTGGRWTSWQEQRAAFRAEGLNSTGKGILIGMMSAFGSAAIVGIIIAMVYFFRYTSRGKIFLDRMSRPGEYDDEQAFLREEEEAMAEMDELQKAEYLRAKGESA